MKDVVVIDQVHRTHQHQVEDHDVKDPDTILNAGIPNNSAITVRYHDGKQSAPELNAKRCGEVVVQDVFNYETEPQEVANDR